MAQVTFKELKDKSQSFKNGKFKIKVGDKSLTLDGTIDLEDDDDVTALLAALSSACGGAGFDGFEQQEAGTVELVNVPDERDEVIKLLESEVAELRQTPKVANSNPNQNFERMLKENTDKSSKAIDALLKSNAEKDEEIKGLKEMVAILEGGEA